MSKKIAPVRRTCRSTSDNASINLSADDRARTLDGWSFERRLPIARLSDIRIKPNLTGKKPRVKKKSDREPAFAAALHFGFRVRPAPLANFPSQSSRNG